MTSPIQLPPRFEIRKLEPKHLPWVLAVINHSNMFNSPVWPVTYPEDRTKRTYQLCEGAKHLMGRSVDSGLSYGIFDKEYVFKRPESAVTGGELYWDATNTEATEQELLEQMDFPLVAIALSYDGLNEPKPEELKDFVGCLPLIATLFTQLSARDQRDPATWKAKAAGEVLMRSGTATRADYEGRGLTKTLAHWLMHEAAGMGYRGIQVECAHPAVHKTWINPPAPFKAQLISELDSNTYEAEVDGKMARVFAPADVVFSKIYVTLKE
ncbi:hypothetical protein QBC46DRAFT_31105 [Diplogelasinospora grovesii]|uniref:Uncharacterized protein n=1 Tax=Diplogelasinospora grovesii TaxID=303347 RepID=A0AAN6S0Y5_9PEZI|nr:hypothetical protein QBC46DRAFT_31105 [Diplogelasinospora grovesii]